MATQYGQQNILAAGYSKKGGSVKTDRRGVGSVLVQPGQFIGIQSAKLFSGLLPGGATSGAFLITAVDLQLQEDTVNPYMVTITFADRPDSADDDLFDHLIGEQGRVNAALEQTDVAQTVTDLQSLADIVGATELLAVGLAAAPGGYHVGDAGATVGNFTI
ncbi:MAG: hypothetical protein JWR37_2530 [Mycobacterium sp.]|nr:hypothetical protein [Mycobacterium sp.]